MRNPQYDTPIPNEVDKVVEKWCGPNCKIANVWYNDETYMITVHVGRTILSLRVFKIDDHFEISQDNMYRMGENCEPENKK